MNVKERAAKVFDCLTSLYPKTAPHLKAKNPWQLLTATILSAQCTDARVNMVTPRLFKIWPGPQEMAGASQEELEEVIRSTGFYRNKAKNLLACARMIVEKYGGEVPASMEELILLPGVARKTANCVLWGAFGINEGIAIDTHVKRIAFRLGLTTKTDPDMVEKDLVLLFPRENFGAVNNRMVSFGRDICIARSPKCQGCIMLSFCPQVGV